MVTYLLEKKPDDPVNILAIMIIGATHDIISFGFERTGKGSLEALGEGRT